MPAFFLALYLALWATEGRPFSSLIIFFNADTSINSDGQCLRSDGYMQCSVLSRVLDFQAHKTV